MPEKAKLSGITKAGTPVPAPWHASRYVRLGALVVVMFGHCALLLATLDSSGLRIGNLLGELPSIAPITWVVQVMPLFFLAGGAAGAATVSGTAGGTYKVKPGDTLTKIARAHGITVNQLRAANNMKTTQVQVGKVLKIPARSQKTAAADTNTTHH